MEGQLRNTQEELLVQSGRASVLKDKLNTTEHAHSELKEKFRVADTVHRSEMEQVREKHEQDLENARMLHLFEVRAGSA